MRSGVLFSIIVLITICTPVLAYDGFTDPGDVFTVGTESSTVPQAKLLAADGAVSDSFGDTVSIDGNVAIVGASGDDDHGVSSGSAYIFRYNGSSWV